MKNRNSNSVSILSRSFFLLGLLLLLPIFYSPLWEIHMDAPQYPEGLTMDIHYNTIVGGNENDLENINLLNHYIGMKKIIPDSIPELHYMKYIILGLFFLGLVALVIGRKNVLWSWIILATLVGVVGIYDFNSWEEEYGSELNPHAPIKVEGMVYKPPLIGEKQLLNITATSYPEIGGLCFVFSIVITALATITAHKRTPHGENKVTIPSMGKIKHAASMAMLAPLMFVSCTVEPSPILYGKDACSHCMMLISDSRFGSEVLTKKGKIYKFDSIECMIRFLEEGKVKEDNLQFTLTTDYTVPGTLMDAGKANYLISSSIQSPMGGHIAAFAQVSTRDSVATTKPGKSLDWNAAKKAIGR